jgi:nucleoside-diphosphate-sugar epimerase
MNLNVLILGGGGFLGKRLASQLLSHGGLAQGEIARLTLVDIGFPEHMPQDQRLQCLKGDFSDASTMEKILSEKPDIMFHLAAIVSGEAEKNLDLGMKVNFHASLQLLELCRKLRMRPRIVFSSSCGVFGGDISKVVRDDTAPKPRSSYGTEKVMVELLMNDYSRRRFADARSLRLPTIAVRPGKPNAATSSFVSSIIREPLNGKRATYPVPPQTAFWIQSPRRVIQNFIHAANLDETLLGDDRIINLPGLTVSVEEMINSLKEITSAEVTNLIHHESDPFLESIVLTWPPHFDTERANNLGFVRDASAEEIIRSHIAEEGITI